MLTIAFKVLLASPETPLVLRGDRDGFVMLTANLNEHEHLSKHGQL